MKTQFKAVLAVALLSACSKVTTIEVTPAAVSLDSAGKSATLSVRVLDQNQKPMEGVQLTYESSNPQVATVDPTGKITAVKSGAAKIAVKAGDKASETAVDVKIPAKLTINPSPLNIVGIGVTTPVQAVVQDDADRPIADAKVVLESADANIAQVADGVVTAAAPGSTKLKATFGALSQEVELSVALPPVGSVAVEPAAPAMKVGDALAIKALVKDPEGKDLTTAPATFASSDEKVATVDAKGNVTAVAAGKATITATAGDKSATATVTVKK